MRRRHAGAHLDELQLGGRKPTETSFTKFCYKRVNLFFEKPINIEISHFFEPTWQLSWPLCKCRFTQKLRNSSVLYHWKPRTLLKQKFVWKLVFSCSNACWSKIAVGSILFKFEFWWHHVKLSALDENNSNSKKTKQNKTNTKTNNQTKKTKQMSNWLTAFESFICFVT